MNNWDETDTVCPQIVLSHASSSTPSPITNNNVNFELSELARADTLILPENLPENQKKQSIKKKFPRLLPDQLKQRSVPVYSSRSTLGSWMNFAASRTVMEMARERDKEAVNYLSATFNAKECANFKPRIEDKAGGPFAQTQRCHCGAPCGEHHPFTQPDGRAASPPSNKKIEEEEEIHEIWNGKDSIKQIPTNAYGRINFYPKALGYQKPAKYVRLSNDTDMSKVMELIVQFWHLTAYTGPPELVISIIGGGKQFRISDSRKKQIFSRGIIRSIQTTRGWLLTSGVNCGVSKAVGQAVSEGQTLEWYDNGRIRRTITCIGICPWGMVRNREGLVNSDLEKLERASYYVDPVVRRWQPVSLNPHHSHFLLVDDGYRNRETGVAHFRATLERMLAAPTEEGGLGVPVVCLLVEGGANSLDQLLESLTHGSPVLICQGTGRVADLLAESIKDYQRIENIQDNEHKQQEMRRLKDDIEATFAQFYSHVRTSVGGDYAVMADKTINLCRQHDMITLFELETQSDLDLAILSCLMERNQMDLASQLKLAHRWNRPDVATAKIVSDPGFYMKEGELNQLLEEALVRDMPEFVRLFINQGISMGRFLTVGQLRLLYNDTIADNNHISFLMKRAKLMKQDDVSLSDIYALIKSFTRRFRHDLYSDDDDANSAKLFEHPHQELFLWAVLLNRQSMALLFWEHCVDPLIYAIVGTLICHCISTALEENSSELCSDYQVFKGQLEELAIGLVTQAYESNRQQSIYLIQKPSETWGGLNSMDLAGLADDKAFLASTCCQHAIFNCWKAGFDANGLEIVISVFFLLPIFWVINFDEDQLQVAPGAPPKKTSRPPKIVAMRPLIPTTERYFTEQISVGDTAAYKVRRQPSVPAANKPKLLKQVSLVQATTNRPEYDFPKAPPKTSLTKRIPCLHKFIKFNSTPVAKFTLHTFWYIMYLLLYSYVVLFSLKPHDVLWPEYVLYFWQLTFIMEASRNLLHSPSETFPSKLFDWFYAYMWKLDVVVSILSVVGFCLRWFPETFPIARLVLVLNLVLYITRVFRVYFANSYLGPKVVMIKRMSWDLAMFLLVAIIFFASYSVAYQALVKSDRKWFYWGIFWDLYITGIWELFGEPSENAMLGTVEGCPIDNGTWTLDCALRSYPIPILLSCYLFFGNILLVNMLIAIFAHVFEDIQANSEQVWKFQMFFLVQEYSRKPLLAPPFIIFHHIYYVTIWFLRKLCCAYAPEKPDLIIDGRLITERDLQFLQIFERVCRADFMENRKRVESAKLPNVVAQLQEHVNRLSERLAQYERVDTRDSGAGYMSLRRMRDESNATSMISLQPALMP